MLGWQHRCFCRVGCRELGIRSGQEGKAGDNVWNYSLVIAVVKKTFQDLQKSVLLVNSSGVLSTLFRKTRSCLCREVCM